MRSDLEQWEEDLYNSVFDNEYFAFKCRISEKMTTFSELKEMIAAEYIHQGQDHDGGSGVIKQITSEASIDAMERTLREWKAGEII